MGYYPIMQVDEFKYIVSVFNQKKQISIHQSDYFGDIDLYFNIIKKYPQAFKKAGYDINIICPECIEPHDIQVNLDNRNAYCHYNGLIPINLEQIKCYVICSKWFLLFLKEALKLMKMSCPEVIYEEEVELWKVGTKKINQKIVPIYLGRDPLSRFEIFKNLFQNDSSIQNGIVILAFSNEQTIENGVKFLNLSRLLEHSFDDQKMMFQDEILERSWLGEYEEKHQTLLLQDGRCLQHNGKQHIFSGERHQKVIRALYENFKKGNAPVHTSSMMNKLFNDTSVQLSQLFKGHKTWKEVIQYGDKHGLARGYCNLKA